MRENFENRKLKNILKQFVLIWGVLCLSQAAAQAPIITGPDKVEVGIPITYQVEFNKTGITITDIKWDGDQIGQFSAPGSGIVKGSINGMSIFPVSSGTTKSATYICGSDFAPTPFAVVKVMVFYTNAEFPSGTSEETELDIEILGISNFSIFGPATLLKCCNNLLTYTAIGYGGPSPSGFTFSWTFPPNWSVSGSSTSESITLVPDGITVGDIRCTIRRTAASNSYFKTRTRALTIMDQFIVKGGSFKQNKICYNEVLTYNVGALCNASSYNWTFPSGWTIQSGQGTNTVVVQVGTNAVDGSVFITAVFANGCTPVSNSFTLDVLTEAPSLVKDDKLAGSYENYHCGNWKYCFPGSSYGNLIFAEELSSVQQWTFRTQHPFRVNGQLQVTTNEPFATVSCVSNPAPNTGMLQIQGVNCQGSSPWYSVNFVKEINYWCTESVYPPYCECCTPPCAACPPYMVNEVNPDFLNQSDNNFIFKEIADAKSIVRKNITAFPNPSASTISIEWYQLGSDIIMYDSKGLVVYSSKRIRDALLTVDVSAFANGMYLISEQNGVEYRYAHFIKTAQ